MTAHRPDPRRWRAGAALAVAALALGLAAPQAPAAAADAPAVKQATRIADRAYPGIQLVSNYYTADVAVPEAVIDQAALRRLVSRLERQVLVGAVDSTEGAVVDAMVDDIAKNITTYFKPGSKLRTTNASVGYVGTGWVVTPDGYMVTAAHVVDTSEADLVQAFAQTAIDTFIQEDVKDLQSGGTPFTDEQVAKLVKAIRGWDAKYLTLDNVKQQLSAQIGVAVPGFGKNQKGVPVEVVSKGEPFPGKDVAVLKMEGQTHLPTLPVGVNADVTAGSTLYVAGYTGASTFYSGMSADSEVQPAVTEGPISAIKSNTAGVPYFQTQAPAGHGNSGGPVMDDRGDVVGILVAGSIDPGSGQMVEGQQWVLPISVVSEQLSRSNIKPTTSDTTARYDEALDAFYARHYKDALPLFQQVMNIYPGHPYAQEFVTKSQTAINAGQDRTPSGAGLLVLLGIGGVVVLVVVLGVVLLLRRGRRPKAGAAPQQLAGPQPGQPQYAPGYGQPYPQPGGQPQYAQPNGQQYPQQPYQQSYPQQPYQQPGPQPQYGQPVGQPQYVPPQPPTQYPVDTRHPQQPMQQPYQQQPYQQPPTQQAYQPPNQQPPGFAPPAPQPGFVPPEPPDAAPPA